MPVHWYARHKRRESEAMETKYDIGSGSQEELNRSKVIAGAVHSKVRGCSSRTKELHEDLGLCTKRACVQACADNTKE